MSKQTIKGKDAFWDLLCHYLANDVTHMPQPDGFPVQFTRINQDHCPEGYRGIRVFVKETELNQYGGEE